MMDGDRIQLQRSPCEVKEASPRIITQSCLMNSNAELPHEVTDQAQVSPQDSRPDSLLIPSLTSLLLTSSQALTLPQPHLTLSNLLPGQAQGSLRSLRRAPPGSAKLKHHFLTLDRQLCNGPAPFLHLTDVDSIIIRGDILHCEAAVGALLLDVVLLALLQLGLLLEPSCLCPRSRHFALEGGRFLLPHLQILQFGLEGYGGLLREQKQKGEMSLS